MRGLASQWLARFRLISAERIGFNRLSSGPPGQESNGTARPEPQRSEVIAASSILRVQAPDRTNNRPIPELKSCLPAGSKVTGDLLFETPVVVDGQIEGTITAKEPITIGEHGSITGKLTVTSAVIAGTVKADIKASGGIEICATGKVWGDVESTTLVVHEGARLEGQIIAKPTPSALDSRAGLLLTAEASPQSRETPRLEVVNSQRRVPN